MHISNYTTFCFICKFNCILPKICLQYSWKHLVYVGWVFVPSRIITPSIAACLSYFIILTTIYWMSLFYKLDSILGASYAIKHLILTITLLGQNCYLNYAGDNIEIQSGQIISSLSCINNSRARIRTQRVFLQIA